MSEMPQFHIIKGTSKKNRFLFPLPEDKTEGEKNPQIGC